MKKIALLFICIIGFMSCDINDTPIELTATNTITKDLDVNAPATSGSPFSFDESVTVNLSDIVSNVGDVTSVKINSLSYKFKEFSGNTAGVVQSISLKVNGTELASASDLNIFDEIASNSVFNITDASKLTQLENILTNDSQTSLQLVGSVLTDAGTMTFKVEISVNMTVTLKS